jgi:hypothetical protein
MKKSNKFLTIFLVAAILIVSFFAYRVFVLRVGRGDFPGENYEELVDSIYEEGRDEMQEVSIVLEEVVEDAVVLEDEKIEIPESVLLDVDFLSQAPFGIWDEYHDDACEEASLIMLEHFLNQKPLNNTIGEEEILGLIDFQMKNYGDFKDTNVEETVRMAREFYKRENLKVVYDIKKDDIKKELAKGNPVIIPVAGRLLGNAFYTPPGPLYHNVVVIGYDGDMIITNDPGTRRGAGYKYNFNIFYDAIHDFTGKKEDILSGRKAMIVVE